MSARLTVDELAVSCRVGSAGHGQPQRAQEILDRVIGAVTNELAGLISQVLATEPDSDEIVYVPAVHFDATVNAAWSADRIARALVVPLMRSVWRSIADPSAIRFRDRAELLARFMLDLTQGQAFTRDWHEKFVGLKLLPASALLRTLVEGEPQVARKALTRLMHDQLRRCVGLLSGSDARRVLEAIQCDRVPDGLTLRAIVDVLISQSCRALDEPQHQLIFAIAVCRETGHASDSNTLALARAALRVAGEVRLEAMTELDCRDLLLSRMLTLMRAQGSVAELRAELDAASLGEDSMLVVLTALREAFGASAHVEERSVCGGPWLLLPAILDFVSVHDVGDHLPACAFAAAALAAGDDALEVWRDEALRKALSLDDETMAKWLDDQTVSFAPRRSGYAMPLSPGSKRRSRVTLRGDRAYLARSAALLPLPPALGRLARRAAWRALLRYAQRLPGFAESSFRHLWANFLRAPAHVRTHERQIEVLLDRPPLHVIWKISGADRATYVLPGGQEVRIREATR